MKISAVKHPITEFMKARQTLRTEKIIDERRKYIVEDFKVLFPLKTYPSSHQENLIKKRDGELLEVEDDIFPKNEGKTQSLKDLEENLPFVLPKSVTQAGNIILINQLPREGEEYKEKVGILLKRNFNARAVFLKEREIKGEKRVANWLKLAGRGKPIALYKELGFFYFVDFSRVFFNPRMSGERKRVISQAKKNEIVLDMFAGVGPFSIPISKKGKKVYAIDINPEAIKFLKINKKLNKIGDTLVPILGDAKKKVQGLKTKVDRIIMNYPSNSLNFLGAALDALKKDGFLHLYCFTYEEDEKKALKKTEKRVKAFFHKDFKDHTITRSQISHVCNVAPAKHLIALDLMVGKTASF